MIALIKRERKSPLRNGASKRTRTVDLLITNQLLYQLSYAGSKERELKRFFAKKSRGLFSFCKNRFTIHPTEL